MKNDIDVYISQSMEWYISRYLFLKNALLHLIIILLLMMISMYIATEILNITSTTEVMRFPIYVENNSDENHYIRSLYQKNKSTDEVFAEYMIKRYISLRELYSPNLLEPQAWKTYLLNISAVSSYKTFANFLNSILPSKNTNSRIIRYRFNVSITPTINAINLYKFSNKRPTEAEIYFSTAECKDEDDTCVIKNYVSVMKFEITSVPDFKFRISEYTRYKVTDYLGRLQ